MKFMAVVMGLSTLCSLAHGNDSPPWVLRRAFSESRIFVFPSSTLGLLYAQSDVFLLDGAAAASLQSRYGVQAGLGNGLEVAVALGVLQSGYLSPLQVAYEEVDVRWAWASWGELWGNPVLQGRLVRLHNAAPTAALSIELGDGDTTGWRWALRGEMQRQLRGSAMAQTYGVSGGGAYQLVTVPISMGLEASLQATDHAGQRLSWDTWQVRVGPLFRWLPVPQAYALLWLAPGLQELGDNDSSVRTWALAVTGRLGWNF